MPTPEEIKKIVRDYAKEILSKQPMKVHAIPEIWEKAVTETEKPLAELFEPLITYLSKDYCIVEKSKVAEWVNDIKFFMPDKRSKTMLEIGAKSLFGKELFNNIEQ